MAFKIIYESRVIEDDIKRLSQRDKEQIRRAVEEKLTSSPEIFGKPLRHSLKGRRKLRVGDYRVIFVIEGNEVKVLAIGHRSDIYRWFGRKL